MKIVAASPFNIKQAIAICNEYQHLKGNVVISDNADFEVVDCVCIVPHDKLERLLFFKLFKEMKDAEKALTFYQGKEYDIALILRELVPIGDFYYKIMGLTEYLKKEGLTSNVENELMRAISNG